MKKSRLFSFFRSFFRFITSFAKELKEFLHFIQIYFRGKTIFLSTTFEKSKNAIVKTLLLKRGRLNRIFLHISAMVIFSIGALISPILSESNPFTHSGSAISLADSYSEGEETLTFDDVFETQESKKPRDKVIEYNIQKGDTLSTIAKRFGISTDTIKWENTLPSDSITVGETLRILPVSGIAHKVDRGDTVYSIAKKYDTNPQGIVDFPFNDFANPQTFSLVEGQILIVPEGIKPEEKPVIVRRRFFASGPVEVSGAGFTWPLRGSINQFYVWYHPGIDIGADVGAPIVAAQSGKVVGAYTFGWHGGYGIHTIVEGDNGYTTLYAHMSGLNVGVGERVTAGSTLLGWVGMSGRTTGAHLHFEIRGGGLLNPLSFLR